MARATVIIGALMAVAHLVQAGPSTSTRKPSHNWSGGVNIQPNGTIHESSAEIVVPECTVGIPSYDYVPYFVTGWVGIDGDGDCKDVLFQTGFDCFVVRENNVTNVTYSIWTEWFPAPAVYYNETLDLQAGDVLFAKVVAHNATSGTSYLENRRNGQKISTFYSDQPALCQSTAEWVIESELSFDSFGLDGERTAGYTPYFQFRDAKYKTIGEHTTYLAQADDMFDMVQDNITVAHPVWQSPGNFFVNDTTPADFAKGM